MSEQIKKTSRKSLPPQDQAPLEDSLNFEQLERLVFVQSGKDIFLGGKKVTDEMRSILREQAKYIVTSNLWEVLNSTIINEASNLALLQSENFDQVRFAKALHHWGHVFRNIMYILSKDA